jgi:ketosteroid isomerase-like protein
MTGPDGKVIPPTGRKFKVDFCTVAKWKNGEIVEEKLFYDKPSLLQQIGLM